MLVSSISCKVLRSGRSQTGLLRSRRRPTPAPHPRTLHPRIRPALPAPPQPSSPSRPKIRPQRSPSRAAPLRGRPCSATAPPFTPPGPISPPGSRIPTTQAWTGDAVERDNADEPPRAPCLMTTDIFFQIVTPDEALARLFERLSAAPRSERVGLDAALGRVTAAPLVAPENSPAFARSAMDGYAVRAADTYGASEALPAFLTVDGEVPMGAAATRPIQPGTAQLIHTGGMLPPRADAVVMVEYTQPVDETSVEVLRPAAPGQHVIRVGEDLAAGDVLLPAGRQLRAQDLGVLAALGITKIEAAVRPVVGVLSSGDEIVPAQAAPAPGQVRDVNATTLSALARQAGAQVRDFGIAPDDRTELERRTRKALNACDLVVISAGSSVSTRDMTADVIGGLGQPGVLAHGIAVKPGKPTIVALAGGKPVFGLPGNPVSALVVFGLMVVPTIRRLLGAGPAHEPRRRRARLTRSLASQTGRIDFVPAALQRRDDGWWAAPILGPSNLIATLVRASGLIRIPLDAGGLAEGAWVDVQTF